ncbi:hypothetical protein Salmuc_01033 [Salipiger mucosus DSM 16094]|uniref:Uncharacterized protein n=1 Tax=Salipiger mucosus DSM 16094 TaxID=1123237 RepID=S9QPJ8_9RHOB|nr:hypothetical protein Salmuc_01033 [Salipiger mucosus DSM 16094]
MRIHSTRLSRHAPILKSRNAVLQHPKRAVMQPKSNLRR